MRKYSISFVLIVLTCMILLTSCNPYLAKESVEDKEKVQEQTTEAAEVRVIHIFISCPEYSEAFQQLINQYESIHPEIHISYETTQNDYPTLLKVRMNSGKTPDLFTTGTGKEIDIYRNWTYDLSEEALTQTMLPNVRKLMTSQEGKRGVYGVALKENYFGLIYNKRILREAGIDTYPTTISELQKTCRILKEKGYQPFTTGYSEWWVFKHIWQQFLTAAAQTSGVKVKDLVAQFENGTANLEDYPELSKNIYEFIDLTIQYGDEYPKNTAMVDELESFAQGKTAMIVGQGTWVENQLMQLNPELELGIGGYPVSEDPSQCQLIAGADQAVRVYKDSKYLQDVLDFVNWWYTSDYGKSWFTEVAGVLPPVKTSEACDYQLVKEGRKLIERDGANIPAVCYSSDRFFQQLGTCFQEYIGGKTTQDKVNRRIAQIWKEIEGREEN